MGVRRQGPRGHLPLWKCCKVFCALAVTVNSCVLTATTKTEKIVNFFQEKVPPPGKKNPAGAHGGNVRHIFL